MDANSVGSARGVLFPVRSPSPARKWGLWVIQVIPHCFQRDFRAELVEAFLGFLRVFPVWSEESLEISAGWGLQRECLQWGWGGCWIYPKFFPPVAPPFPLSTSEPIPTGGWKCQRSE